MHRRSFAENCRPNADHGCAFFDGDLEIATHSHREVRQTELKLSRELIAQPAQRDMSERARGTVEQNRGAASRTAARILELLA